MLGGSGNGEAITANRVRGIRCVLCWNEESARLGRQHNDANMLSLGQRMMPLELALSIVRIWLDTPFEGGRHVRRIQMIDEPVTSRDVATTQRSAGRWERTGSRTGEVLAPLHHLQDRRPGRPLLRAARRRTSWRAAILAAREHGVPFFLLGLGANILVGDRGFRGLVIRNLARRIELLPTSGAVRAESGAVVYPDLIEAAVSPRPLGLEHYVGIP